MSEPSVLPTTEERLLAAVAHAAALLTGLGVLAPLLVWSAQRGKSRYVTFQALQALGYQVLLPVLGLLAALVVGLLDVIAIFILGLVSGGMAYEVSRAILFGLQFAFLAILLFIVVLLALLGLLGGLFCLFGKNFRYPWLGSWLESRLFNAEGIVTEQEDAWVAASAHTSLFLGLFGLMVPLIVLLTQKGRSRQLRFQSLQALIYQLIGQIAGGLILIPVSMLGVITAVGVAQMGGEISGAGDLLVLGLILLGLFGGMVLALLVPVYQTIPLVGAWQLLQGKSYRYPLLGKWLYNPAESQKGSEIFA